MAKALALLTVTALLVAAATAYAATGVAWHTGTNKTVKIRKGGTVKWTWADGQPHDVKGPGFSSKVIAKKGFTFSHRFGKKGTYRIICLVHSNMHTTVKVG